MQLVGQIWRVREGKAQEYATRHRTIWPELEQLLRQAGVRRYVIYAWGELLFSHIEVEDYERLVSTFNASATAQRWEREMSGLIEYPNADPQSGWAEQLRQIWSM